MTSYHALFAVALLVTPPDVLEIEDGAQLHQHLAPSVRALALQLELLDPREVNHLLADPRQFVSELKVLQGRYQELKTAPALAEVTRLPSRDVAADLLAFNRSYRDGLTSRLEVDMVHAEELRTALSETDQLHRIWDMVRDARCEYYYVTYRRQALMQLREAVGAQAFYSGQLPPHVPLWRIPIVN
jgi:hypothetical protein